MTKLCDHVCHLLRVMAGVVIIATAREKMSIEGLIAITNARK